MKFICEKGKFFEAVQNTAKAAAGKSPIPALEGILLTLEGNELTITGYDLDIGIKTNIDVVGKEDGEIVLSARLINDIIRKMPSGDISVEADEKCMVNLTAGDVEFAIMGLSSNDYPIVPSVNPETSFTMPQASLKSMIGQTLFAIATTDTKPVHMGSKFEVIDNVLNVVSVDGVRMARRQEPVIFSNIGFVVPGKTLNEIQRMLEDDSEKTVTMCIDRNQISFSIGSYVIISRLLEGDFINYNNVMNFTCDTWATVNCREFIDTLDRTLLLINDKHKSPVKCEFNGDTLSVSCTTALGKINDKINIEYNGNPLTIGFNAKYMLDALKNSDSDQVKILLSGALSPIKITPMQGESFSFLVLPVRLKSE